MSSSRLRLSGNMWKRTIDIILFPVQFGSKRKRQGLVWLKILMPDFDCLLRTSLVSLSDQLGIVNRSPVC